MITSLSEKKRGQRRTGIDSEAFKEFIEETSLINMETTNVCFTWSNKWKEKHQLTFRLNIFLISKDLLMSEVDVEANILPSRGSDYWPVILIMQLASNTFMKASSMDLNLFKSVILFFNTHIAIQRNLTTILGFHIKSLPSRYLGVPLTTQA